MSGRAHQAAAIAAAATTKALLASVWGTAAAPTAVEVGDGTAVDRDICHSLGNNELAVIQCLDDH